MASIPLSGRWKLESFVLHEADGKDTFPLGPDAIGQLSYGDDGHVNVLMMSATRPQIGWQGLNVGTPQEFEDAYNSVVGYCGRYEVSGDQVIHHIEIAIIPRQTGTVVVRQFKLEDGKLYLNYQNPAGVQGSLIWTRI